jgi:hypothetical protein
LKIKRLVYLVVWETKEVLSVGPPLLWDLLRVVLELSKEQRVLQWGLLVPLLVLLQELGSLKRLSQWPRKLEAQ